jgi:hypothetical protein
MKLHPSPAFYPRLLNRKETLQQTKLFSKLFHDFFGTNKIKPPNPLPIFNKIHHSFGVMLSNFVACVHGCVRYVYAKRGSLTNDLVLFCPQVQTESLA